MTDFRGRNERRDARARQQQEQLDYKQAFEEARDDVARLTDRIEALEGQFTELQTLLKDQTQTLREQLESGLAKLEEDNERLHAMIRSAQEHDSELIEQMNKNHRERLEALLHLKNDEPPGNV